MVIFIFAALGVIKCGLGVNHTPPPLQVCVFTVDLSEGCDFTGTSILYLCDTKCFSQLASEEACILGFIRNSPRDRPLENVFRCSQLASHPVTASKPLFQITVLVAVNLVIFTQDLDVLH